MTVSVAELDAMPDARAAKLLSECCGSSQWVKTMVGRRPFGSRDAVFAAAEEVWRSLDANDWLGAFAHHPRIGEQKSATPQGERGSDWSAAEQGGVDRAQGDVREALARANREYERRFGFIYIVCATGKTAEEMTALAQERMRNDPDLEIGVAAEEQRKITRLRLAKLLVESDAEEEQG
jgi:OHCU decarboxylase